MPPVSSCPCLIVLTVFDLAGTGLPPAQQVADAPALGCAILAAVAAGLFPDVPAACAAMVHQVG